jgi:hypothetical protein
MDKVDYLEEANRQMADVNNTACNIKNTVENI